MRQKKKKNLLLESSAWGHANMGRCIELVTGLTTAPGAAYTAATALTGNSFTVRDGKRGIRMIAQWDTRQALGMTSISSPLMHDSTVGIQHGADDAQTRTRILLSPQPMHAQDNLSVQMTGSAVAGDIEHMSMILEYEDLQGVDGRFITPDELSRRCVNHFSNDITIATGATGLYTGQVAVTSGDNVFKANTDYALIGYDIIDSPVHAVRWIGPDFGNVGIGGPANYSANGVHTAQWFIDLAKATSSSKTIPVMNSANAGLTMIDAVADENGANPQVIMYWAELRK